MVKVLIAEDEIPLLWGIQKMIENLNSEFEVMKCAHNGKESIEYLEQKQVDVIFTDINMPLADELEILKYANTKYPNIITAVISGYNDFGYAQQAIRYGVKEYLLKPIVKEELERILSGIARQCRQNALRKQKETLTDVVYMGKKGGRGEKVQMIRFCSGPFFTADMEENVVECDFWHGIDIEAAAAMLLPDGADSKREVIFVWKGCSGFQETSVSKRGRSIFKQPPSYTKRVYKNFRKATAKPNGAERF